MTANGWFAARPSGTENIYKIYAESFKSEAHLTAIVEEAQQIVDAAQTNRDPTRPVQRRVRVNRRSLRRTGCIVPPPAIPTTVPPRTRWRCPPG